MSDLVGFLLARIAEDEAAARESVEYEENVWEAAGWLPPSRVLAECEAKRRIVEQYADAERRRVADPLDMAVAPRRVFALERVLRALALPYADHPDYREEWRP